MTPRLKIIIFIICCIIAASSSNGSANEIITAVVLRDLTPVSFWDQKVDRANGFGVDLADAIAARAGLKVRYLVVNNWQEAEDAIKEGRADICPILVTTEARKKQFFFTAHTETSGITITVRANSNINNLGDLKGHVAGTLRASQVIPILDKHPEIIPAIYDSSQIAVLELIAGRIDAYLGPDNVVLKIVREAGISDQIRIVQPPLAEIKRAIAVSKNREELFKLLDHHTREFVASPEYRAIYTKWYGAPPPFWSTQRVVALIGILFGITATIFLIWRYRLMQVTIQERTRTADELHSKAVQLEEEISERQKVQESLHYKTLQLEDEIAERQKIQESLKQLNDDLETHITAAVADMRKKDELLIHQSRLAAMGELLTSIAHQWRQPLNNVAVCIQSIQYLYQQNELTEEEMSQQIGMVMDMLRYMSGTIDDFRNFFRQDREQQMFSVEEVVRRTVALIGSALDSNRIMVEIDGEKGVYAQGFPNEYAQALINILYNARDVLIDRGVAEPKIEISIGTDNGRSRVTVLDNAGGIPVEIMPQLFDPYFTTKGPATGTGIGLYMARTLIERNMGGSITARNLNGGAAFTILL